MSHDTELDKLPAALRALLGAELAAGNAIVEVAFGFPAPPAGFYVLLEKPISTRAGTANDGLVYDEWPNWKNYSGYKDPKGHFFVLGASAMDAGPDYPVMRYDAQGIAIPATASPHSNATPPVEHPSECARSDRHQKRVSAVDREPETDLSRRFRESMNLDYEKWREGIGYDLEALNGMNAAERAGAEALLLSRGINDWRDVEALALLDTETARKALRSAMDSGDAKICTAVARFAPERVSHEQQTASLIAALATAKSFAGLGETLDAIAEFHPPEVVDALWRGLEKREGEVAVHLAALLYYIHGLADEPFDWGHRPFFLTFHTEDGEARRTAIAELRRRINEKKA